MTRKITQAVARIRASRQDRVYLGNLNASRDWGYAPEYVEAMWLMLNVLSGEPDDCVIATGETHTVREFAEVAFGAGGFRIEWQGEGAGERGVNAGTGEVPIEVDPRYFRPAEVDLLIGDASKARGKLGWQARTRFDELARLMVEADVQSLER